MSSPSTNAMKPQVMMIIDTAIDVAKIRATYGSWKSGSAILEDSWSGGV
eukprot:CAMPEP_0117438558 /NCGR_PEP_ID=MMETSP0759-20121206/2114_1 /TAXON_ID=63605 /ORGANISM="Percolomonas cosmopolitus, Strain WS" /LENGTH=48 /DNA_ID= /DNA_START= /DNA_END= /DNA_ORIENTATION=